MLQRRHLHASEVALVVKFGAYTVIFKNILYLKMVSLRSNPVLTYLLCGKYLHCKCFDHKNYEDCRGLCREDLYYLWKRAVRIAGFLHNCRVSLQFLQPISIDSTDFPSRDPSISSPCSFYGQNICSLPFWNWDYLL